MRLNNCLCIRNGTPSCSIKKGFEEAIAVGRTEPSNKLGRRVHFDPTTKSIIAHPGEDLDAVLLGYKVS